MISWKMLSLLFHVMFTKRNSCLCHPLELLSVFITWHCLFSALRGRSLHLLCTFPQHEITGRNRRSSWNEFKLCFIYWSRTIDSNWAKGSTTLISTTGNTSCLLYFLSKRLLWWRPTNWKGDANAEINSMLCSLSSGVHLLNWFWNSSKLLTQPHNHRFGIQRKHTVAKLRLAHHCLREGFSGQSG